MEILEYSLFISLEAFVISSEKKIKYCLDDGMPGVEDFIFRCHMRQSKK